MQLLSDGNTSHDTDVLFSLVYVCPSFLPVSGVYMPRVLVPVMEEVMITYHPLPVGASFALFLYGWSRARLADSLCLALPVCPALFMRMRIFIFRSLFFRWYIS